MGQVVTLVPAKTHARITRRQSDPSNHCIVIRFDRGRAAEQIPIGPAFSHFPGDLRRDRIPPDKRFDSCIKERALWVAK